MSKGAIYEYIWLVLCWVVVHFLSGAGWCWMYCGWWWLVVGDGVVVDGGEYILADGGWLWVVVGDGGWWWVVAWFSLTPGLFVKYSR